MDLNKYKHSSGLDIKCYEKIIEILGNKDNINILEFGSGMSTKFLVEYAENSDKIIYIDSLDNDENFCYKGKTPNYLNLMIRRLITCSDKDYNKQLKNIKIERNSFYPQKNISYKDPIYWRQRNCFYNIKEGDLNKEYDLIILDGPNGNGRNLSYLFFKNKVKKDSFIVIDDFDSKDGDYEYNFEGNFLNIFPESEEYFRWKEGNQAFVIYKIRF